MYFLKRNLSISQMCSFGKISLERNCLFWKIIKILWKLEVLPVGESKEFIGQVNQTSGFTEFLSNTYRGIKASAPCSSCQYNWLYCAYRQTETNPFCVIMTPLTPYYIRTIWFQLKWMQYCQIKHHKKFRHPTELVWCCQENCRHCLRYKDLQDHWMNAFGPQF